MSKQVAFYRSGQALGSEPARWIKRSRANRMLKAATPDGFPRYEEFCPGRIRELDPNSTLPVPVISKRIRWDQGLLIQYPMVDLRSNHVRNGC